MKKILVCSTDVMMYLFLIPHVNKLVAEGYSVDVACSYADEYKQESYNTKIKALLPLNCNYYSISSVRSPFSFKNINAFNELSKIINKDHYDLIWSNEPVVGFLSRLAAIGARKNRGLKVLYLVHGLHFFKGSPLVNWLFYPIEKICSYFTDIIVTINQADFKFSNKHFASKIKYIKGIGFDHSKYSCLVEDDTEKRKEFGFHKNDIIILAVGELLPRKNHAVAIKALSLIKNKSVKLLICGIGGLKIELELLIKSLDLSDRIYFAGQRYDIPEILSISDIFIHPSIREGLGMAPLEAMAAGLPIITSNVQGIPDYSIDEITGYVCEPNDVVGYAKSIDKLLNNVSLRHAFGLSNVELSRSFDITESVNSFYLIIKEALEND